MRSRLRWTRRVSGWVASWAILCGAAVAAQPAPCSCGGAAAHCASPCPVRSTRNVIIFVADGLRHGSVNATDAPTLLSVRERGVSFTNSHSLFPTLTTPNASAIATGHYIGDTGDFSNAIYVGFPIFNQGGFGKHAGTLTPFLENDQVLGDIDAHFPGGNFLHEESLLAIARRHGFNTAAIGKLGPTAIQDVSQLMPTQESSGSQVRTRGPAQTVILDDATGTPEGVPVSADVQAALAKAGLDPSPPKRPASSGAGLSTANVTQQKWFAEAATKAVLPAFERSGRPFVLVYWSRDPDITQHGQGDSLGKLTPGINGPTSRAAVANADDNLRQLLEFIDASPALRATTDVFVTSDHGFATISKHEVDGRGTVASGYSTRFTYLGADGRQEVDSGYLPPGFLAIDLAHELELPLYDPDSPIQLEGASHYEPVDPAKPSVAGVRQHPLMGSGLLGGRGAVADATDATVVVAAGGGTDLIYLPRHDTALVRRIVEFLSRQEYVGALFVDSAYGHMPGALALSAVGMEGRALTPRPAIAVSLASFLIDPADMQSGVQVSDSGLQEGQGMHGGLARHTTFNNMAALGPDFKQGFASGAPVSNADIVPTVLHILGLTAGHGGSLSGRVLVEALAGGPATVRSRKTIARSPMTRDGRATILELQEAGGRRYFDGACSLNLRVLRQHQVSCSIAR